MGASTCCSADPQRVRMMNEKNLAMITRRGSADKILSPEKFQVKHPNHDGKYVVNEKIIEEARSKSPNKWADVSRTSIDKKRDIQKEIKLISPYRNDIDMFDRSTMKILNERRKESDYNRISNTLTSIRPENVWRKAVRASSPKKKKAKKLY